MGGKTHEHPFFFFHETMLYITIIQLDTTVVSIVAVFFKKTAIIIATHGKKTLYRQFSKVILSGMCNCNFEAINYVLNKRMKKLEMEYGPFICTIIFCLIICTVKD